MNWQKKLSETRLRHMHLKRTRDNAFEIAEMAMFTRYAGWVHELLRGKSFASEDVDQAIADWAHLYVEERCVFEALQLDPPVVIQRIAERVTNVGYTGDTMFYHDDLPPVGTTRRARYMERMVAELSSD